VKRTKIGPRLASLALVLFLAAGALSPADRVLLKPANASGPWNGHAVAFTFSSDDGNRPANLAWADLFVSRGLSYTVFIPSSWVGLQSKLTSLDLVNLHDAGIEIGSHGRNHLRLVDLEEAQLFDELIGSCQDLEAAIGGDYLCRTIAYPEHAHDPHVMAAVEAVGFTGARDGGTAGGYPNFSLGSSTWAGTSLFELPLTTVSSYLVGTGNTYSETETRAHVQELLAGDPSAQNYWINIYAHTLNDIDVPHMTWILDELEQSDVWITSFDAVADYYREGHGMAIPVQVGLYVTGSRPGDTPGPVVGRVFPNPLRTGSCRLPFSLPRPGNVTVRILNLSGRSVRTLAAGRMEAGDGSARWDGLDDRGAGAPAGIYFYEIQTPSSRVARKLVKLR
jgi:peptidoglycan/xylan/chitin deacetylase (PgdA/CDA1 family)